MAKTTSKGNNLVIENDIVSSASLDIVYEEIEEILPPELDNAAIGAGIDMVLTNTSGFSEGIDAHMATLKNASVSQAAETAADITAKAQKATEMVALAREKDLGIAENTKLNNIEKKITKTAKDIKEAVEWYELKLEKIQKYLTTIADLPNMVEKKSNEYIEQQLYTHSRKVIAMIVDAQKFLTDYVKDKQKMIEDWVQETIAKRAEEEAKELADKAAAAYIAASGVAADKLAQVAYWSMDKAKRAADAATKAKRITDAVVQVTTAAKDAAEAAKGTLKLKDGVTNAIKAVTDLQVLVNIKNNALGSVNATTNKITSSLKNNINIVKDTTLKATSSITDASMDLVYDQLNGLLSNLGNITELVMDNADILNNIPGIDKVMNLEQLKTTGLNYVNNLANKGINTGFDVASTAISDATNLVKDKTDNPLKSAIDSSKEWLNYVDTQSLNATTWLNESGINDAVNTAVDVTKDVNYRVKNGNTEEIVTGFLNEIK